MSDKINEKIDLVDDASSSSSEKIGGKIKTMVELPENSQSKTILASPNTDTPVVPGNFHEFSGSQAKMYTTFDNRISALEKALGNKAPLVS